jgi:hypothetical protein
VLGCSFWRRASDTLLRIIDLLYSRDQDGTALVYPSVLCIGSRENNMSQISLAADRRRRSYSRLLPDQSLRKRRTLCSDPWDGGLRR